MAQTYREAGYVVDAIHWSHKDFYPKKDYIAYVDIRRNFARFAPRFGPQCLKILHLDTAHHAYHNAAQLRRLEELKQRRGIILPPYKMIETNQSIEQADCATVLGNEFTMGTFRFAGKPLHRIPISAPLLYPFPENKDWNSCRKTFLWFGSDGFVHKGLDLVLEAFSQMKDFKLIVCGPLEKEPKFCRAFHQELYRTPNITVAGWVDVNSPRFIEIANRCAGLVYPSCSEGGGGCVINCMHAGLIPIASYESSVDITPDYGIVLPDCSVETIKAQVQQLAELAPLKLHDMAMAAWQYVRMHHTRDHFRAAYQDFVREKLNL